MSGKTLRKLLSSVALVIGGMLSVAATTDVFSDLVARLEGEKPTFAERHRALLAERYDLADRPVAGVTMANGKPVQGGVRVRLPNNVTWDLLANLTP